MDHQVLVDMMDKAAEFFIRPEVKQLIIDYDIGYDFEAAEYFIKDEEIGAHNPECWIRSGVRVGDEDDTRLGATPFLVWLQSTTDNNVGNFRVRHTLNPVQDARNNMGVVAGLKEIRHRIVNGEAQRYDPFQCQRGRIQAPKTWRNHDEGCTRKADPGSLYCTQCRPRNLSMHERELTRTLQLDDSATQQFEVKLTPSVTLVIKNPFGSNVHHSDSIVDLSNQINTGMY